MANVVTETLEDEDDDDDNDYMEESDTELVSSEGDVSLNNENVMVVIQEATEPFG